MDKDSKEIKELEGLGYKVIFPAELTEEAIARMNDQEKSSYEFNIKQALVVDTKDKNDLELANLIRKDYFRIAGYNSSIAGLDIDNNSLTANTSSYNNFKEGSIQEYKKILEEVGYETSYDHLGNVTAFSDIPYPAVKKSKFSQIYENAKGKIKGMFSAIKDRLNIKNQEKENKKDER